MLRYRVNTKTKQAISNIKCSQGTVITKQLALNSIASIEEGGGSWILQHANIHPGIYCVRVIAQNSIPTREERELRGAKSAELCEGGGKGDSRCKGSVI